MRTLAQPRSGKSIITLTPKSLPDQHICCAISDQKCAEGYEAKKGWLAAQYAQSYRFTRLDARGKVFIEYGPGESAWMPVAAPGWMVMGCFWVSGRFKRQGHGKALLAIAMERVREEGRAGLVSVAGARKMHFQSDGAWLRRQGFREVDRLESGFTLLALGSGTDTGAPTPRFAQSARDGLGADAASN